MVCFLKSNRTKLTKFLSRSGIPKVFVASVLIILIRSLQNSWILANGRVKIYDLLLTFIFPSPCYMSHYCYMSQIQLRLLPQVRRFRTVFKSLDVIKNGRGWSILKKLNTRSLTKESLLFQTKRLFILFRIFFWARIQFQA